MTHPGPDGAGEPDLTDWVGRMEHRTAVVTPVDATRMEHTLDREATLRAGDPLPPLWHAMQHFPSVPHHRISADGHPERGGFLPPVPLPRRMWAGSRCEFPAPIPIGVEIEWTSTIESATTKEGRSGRLCFVTVRHELATAGTVGLVEHQDLVYRDDPPADAPAPSPRPAPDSSNWQRTIEPDEVLLFRYSALTFNAHRIHVDLPYATGVEGYPGLVVQGPLTATLLADLAVAECGPLTSFSFRAMSPLFAGQPFTIHGDPTDDGATLWAATPDGGLAMQATATTT